MKYHVVLKLHHQLSDDRDVPNWVDFITDKSVIRERVTPEIDRVLAERGLKVWLTKEYKSEGRDWSPDEIGAGLNRTYRMILQHDYKLPADLVQQIKLVPDVEDARGLEVGEADLPKPIVATQASLRGPSPADQIYLRYAQAITKGVADVRIAVLDTGVNLSHPELDGKLLPGADFVDLDGLNTSDFIGDITGYDTLPEDEVGHGTHVAGIIAARGLQMDEGVCPGCRIVPMRVLATMRTGNRVTGAGLVHNINPALKQAVDEDVDIINMSLGIRHTGGGLPHEDVIRYALSKNVTVVAASGNDGTAERYYPGALEGVFACGAVDERGNVASFTSYGANITCVAPGVNIHSSFSNNTYALASGTSQAAPFVTGMIGLMKSYARQMGQTLTNSDIRLVLRNTSDKVDHRLRSVQAGYGLINMADAFKLLAYELA